MSSVIKLKNKVDIPSNDNSRTKFTKFLEFLEGDVKWDKDEEGGLMDHPGQADGRLVILKKKQLSVRANVASNLWLMDGKKTFQTFLDNSSSLSMRAKCYWQDKNYKPDVGTYTVGRCRMEKYLFDRKTLFWIWSTPLVKWRVKFRWVG